MFGLKKASVTIAFIVVLLGVGGYYSYHEELLPSFFYAKAPPSDVIVEPMPDPFATHRDFLIFYMDDEGFNPSEAKIDKSDVLRIQNTSSIDLHIVGTGVDNPPYPGSSECQPQGTLDSCRVLKQGEFWDFTSDVAGAWTFHNAQHPTHTGVVIVE